MAKGERGRLLYPGDPIWDADAFQELPDRFSAPPTTSAETNLRWTHDNLVHYLLGRSSLRSLAAEVIGTAEATPDFAKEQLEAKQSATIHLPETDYALPEWAAHFGAIAMQIIRHEHNINARADKQIAQIRLRQSRGQPRNVHPHLDMIGGNVKNFHFYLVADRTPATTYDGDFTYEAHPYPNIKDDPLEFFRDLDVQFGNQIEEATPHMAEPFDIAMLSAFTVHKPPESPPHGRTLFGIQFYELSDTEAESKTY